jgi:hypothetical protein
MIICNIFLENVICDELKFIKDSGLTWMTVAPSFDANLDVKFELYTRAYRNNPQILTADKIIVGNSGFKYVNPTRFLINGWADNSKGKFAMSVKDTLLTYYDLNVIVVNWNKAASDLSYWNAKYIVVSGSCFLKF